MGIISDFDLSGAARRAVGKVVSTPEQAGQSRAAALLNADAGFDARGGAKDQARRLKELAHALRVERQLAASGHWSYDLNRHIALLQAYAAMKQATGKCGR